MTTIEEQFILTSYDADAGRVDVAQFNDYPTATEAGKAWLRSGEADPGAYFTIDKRSVLVGG